ncbi:hypothetical protein BCR35DRAFT_36234 [Leucosporidium creatinivorum]|uniref:Uncharacterized protein n=1 Tax=Leucosporidium creatinivorum TaxID=106004 RepID=A0A1Y2CB54_9BASI|nr:hypothetical protein BCR35DRAFT_36234 [Leucosporidium creatinivorum]
MPSTLLGVRKYSTANDHTSKKAAKEAVVQLAFADRVLDLIQPKSFAKGGGAAVRGGKTGSRGAINGKGAMRGGMNGGGRGGFGGQAQGRFGGPPDGFNNGYATPPYPSQSPHPSPYFNQQQPLPNGQPQHNVHLFGPFAPPPGTPPAQGQDMVAYLDDFCRDWMGPSAPLPSYDVRQDPRTGLFGAVVRLSLAPNDANTKAFWVDFDFHTRADAQEAVARISVMDGVLDVVRREVPRFVGGVVAGAGFGPGPVARQPPPHQQPQTRFQQPQPQPRATGRQPLPPQGSPSVGPQAGGFAQQHRGAGKQDKPRAGTNKASNGPAAKPNAQAQASRDEADGKKSSLMASLYQTYEVLFDGQLSRKPVFDVSPADGSGRFAGSVRIALSPSQVISYTTPSIYTNKRDAKEAAAALAINEGKAVEQMKAVAAGEWAGAGTKASESTSTAEKASASSSSGRAGPAQVGQQGGGGANLASAQSFGLAGAGVAPSHQSAASSVGGAALPSGQGSSALVGVASTASSQPPRASSFGSAQQAQKKEGDSKAMSTLKDFCTSNSYPPPEFSSEAGLTTTSPDGSTSTTGVRVWCIVGELKFELPRPKSVEEGTEKLAGRVLKHLTAEVEKRKTEGTV